VDLALVGDGSAAQQTLVTVDENDVHASFSEGQGDTASLQTSTQDSHALHYASGHFDFGFRRCEL
jgi:hypothetical protein